MIIRIQVTSKLFKRQSLEMEMHPSDELLLDQDIKGVEIIMEAIKENLIAALKKKKVIK